MYDPGPHARQGAQGSGEGKMTVQIFTTVCAGDYTGIITKIMRPEYTVQEKLDPYQVQKISCTIQCE